MFSEVNMNTSVNIFTHNPVSDDELCVIRSRLPDFLSGKRLEHTFFVEKEAITIAESIFLVYNVSDVYKNDIKAAALLHDITKKLSLDEQLALCKEFGIDAGSSPSNAILHGKTAAYLAKKTFGINDFVFSAIYSHTTGKENMNVIDKIIFLADYIEESRTHIHCINTRNFFYDSIKEHGVAYSGKALDDAIVMSIDGTVRHLLEQGSIIDINTILARNYLISENTQNT